MNGRQIISGVGDLRLEDLRLEDFTLGDVVAYISPKVRATTDVEGLEFGFVSSVNEQFVFVQFNPDAASGMACSPHELVRLGVPVKTDRARPALCPPNKWNDVLYFVRAALGSALAEKLDSHVGALEQQIEAFKCTQSSTLNSTQL